MPLNGTVLHTGAMQVCSIIIIKLTVPGGQDILVCVTAEHSWGHMPLRSMPRSPRDDRVLLSPLPSSAEHINFFQKFVTLNNKSRQLILAHQSLNIAGLQVFCE